MNEINRLIRYADASRERHMLKCGFTDPDEYHEYSNSFWSQWYCDNRGKSMWDADVLEKYHAMSPEDKKKFLESTRVAVLFYLEFKHEPISKSI